MASTTDTNTDTNTDNLHQQGHRHIEGSSSSSPDSSAIKYDEDGKFLVSLQVALYNPFVQHRGLPVSQSQSQSQFIEDAYAIYYSTIMRNSIAYLFCTAVRDVLFVNAYNQNVCPTLIATTTSDNTQGVNGGGGGGDADEEDDSLQDTVSIDNSNNSNSSSSNNNNSTPSITPTLLDEIPYQIRVIQRNVTVGNTSDYTNDVFAFTIWYIDYTIIQIGSVYIEEAIIQTGNSDVVWNRSSTVDSVLDITDVSIEAVKAMNVVLQLTLDVNTMDTTSSTTGTGSNTNDNDDESSSFDTLIRTIRNSSLTTVNNGDTRDIDTNPYDRQLRLYLCSSPVVVNDVNFDQNSNIMIQKFTAAYEEFQNVISDTYRSSSTLLSPMRIGGIVLLTLTITTYILLLYLNASRRRRRMKGGVSQPQNRVPQEQAIISQCTATSTTTATPTAVKKTTSNRMLVVPPSVPSSPVVRLARVNGR